MERLEKYHPRINDTSKNGTFKGAWQNVTVCTLFRSCSELTPYRYTNRTCGKECYLVTNHCPWIALPQPKDDFESRDGISNGNSIDFFFCLWMYRIQITLFLLVQIFFWGWSCISFESLMFIFLYFFSYFKIQQKYFSSPQNCMHIKIKNYTIDYIHLSFNIFQSRYGLFGMIGTMIYLFLTMSTYVSWLIKWLSVYSIPNT